MKGRILIVECVDESYAYLRDNIRSDIKTRIRLDTLTKRFQEVQ